MKLDEKKDLQCADEEEQRRREPEQERERVIEEERGRHGKGKPCFIMTRCVSMLVSTP